MLINNFLQSRQTRTPKNHAKVQTFSHIAETVSYKHIRAHETDPYLVCRLLLEKKHQMCQQPHKHPVRSHLLKLRKIP